MTVTEVERNAAVSPPATTPLRARPGLHYAPVPGGVYFSGTRGQFVLRGSELLYAVADGCVPLLRAGTTEEALVAEFGTERARPAVRHLLGKLRENGLLLDAAALTEPEPPAELAARHAETLARLTARLDDPYAAFARLRRARVRLHGPATATAPALRGLRRAGVTDVTVTAAPVTPQGPLVPVCDPAMYADPALLSGSSGSAGGSRALIPAGAPAVHGHGATTPVGGPAVTASVTDEGVPRVVVEFLDGDRTWTEEDGTLHVPVLLGPGPVLVGPIGVAPGAWEVLRDRARAWADAEGVEPATGPIAHSLAGALAAQLLTDTLTGVAEPGEAHVVHGPDLTADRVTVTGAPVSEAVAVRLADTPAEPHPAPEDALDAAGVLTARWTGLFASARGEDLPQMPLALRAAEHRADRAGTVTAWAAHQETATLAAALAALRDRVEDTSGTPAAGLTREHWLLDGALRRLARTAGDVLDEDAPLHAEGHRIAAELRALLGGTAPVLAVSRYAGVGWPLAEVTVDGRPRGAGWGPTATEATYAALCTALAVTQTGGTADRLSTDALLTADDATRAALRAQLTARAGHQGHPLRTDPVLGELPFWYGPVTDHPVRTSAEEATDADH
ncbi:hypothetical protein [Streptomyces sp. NPDC007984]|uniref:hypothetical protein n=1 Tax=Streptomyces sp. NPDC007984 TaxID=3364801 RepID=UPI0036EBF705